MKEEKIFLSYSRSDATFALDLAVKLKEAGANLWMDQLDIRPGARWDTEVGKALEDSECVLVILSATSVSSNNVLDEVSYALEANKRVLPVLVDNCVIPFRLRRLQHINFANNYNDAFNKLVEALEIEEAKKPAAEDELSKKSFSIPVEKQAATTEPVDDTSNQNKKLLKEKQEFLKAVESKPRKTNWRKMTLITALVAAITVVVVMLNYPGSSKTKILKEGMNDSSMAAKSDTARDIKKENGPGNTADTGNPSGGKTPALNPAVKKNVAPLLLLPSKIDKGSFVFHTGSDGRERSEIFISLLQSGNTIWKTRVIVEKPWEPFTTFVFNKDINVSITPAVPLIVKMTLCSPRKEDVSWSGDVVFTLQTNKSPLNYRSNFILNTANVTGSKKCSGIEIPQVK